jgi:hypothetical protein
MYLFCDKASFYGAEFLASVLLTQYCSGDKIEMNEMSGFYSTYYREERGRDHLKDPGIEGKIIFVLRWIFRKWDVGEWTGSSWLRTGKGGGHL